jgi:hypothetical protein
MRAFTILSLTSLLFISTSFIFRTPENEPVLSSNQKEVISYFKEVSLGFEYGNAAGLTRKWTKPMVVFVAGNPDSEHLAELDRVTTELNGLFTDGFQIRITEKREDANFVMYFGSRERFTELYPADAKTVAHSSGLFHIFWNKSNEITRGYLFIHTVGTSLVEQRHTIREELTQALGLGKDSPRYSDSIFQAGWTTPTEFAAVDRELIRLLYHPQMTAGANEAEAELILTQILAAEMISSITP